MNEIAYQVIYIANGKQYLAGQGSKRWGKIMLRSLRMDGYQSWIERCANNTKKNNNTNRRSA